MFKPVNWRNKTAATTEEGTTQKSQIIRSIVLSPDPYLKDKAHSFENNHVHILNRGNKGFEREVKDTIYVKHVKPTLSRGGGLRFNLPNTYSTAITHLPGQFHRNSHLETCNQTAVLLGTGPVFYVT